MSKVLSKQQKPSDETFVRTWAMGAKKGWSLVDVAKRLNLTYPYAYNLARKLTQAGVNLPLLGGQQKRPADQISKLNQIISTVLKGTGIES